MKSKVLALLLVAVAPALAQATDAYNSFLWNRHNVVAQNNKIDRGDWYEWWYYKVVVPETKEAFFFTYGVINPWDSEYTLSGTTAVLQVGDFQNKILLEQSYPLSDFSAAYDQTKVIVGDNFATDKQLAGHVMQNGHDISWQLAMTPAWRFNAMDWAMKVPGISGIYWYPAQASARMAGWIRVDGRTTELNNALAYQDRNWGRNFPKWWTWLTSNSFKNSPGTALAAGGGVPRALESVYLFAGLCIGLKHQGREYAFRTSNGDHVDFEIAWGKWELSAINKHGQKIEISAFAPKDQFMMLPFHTPRGQEFYDYEALLGKMTVKLYDRKGIFSSWKLVANLETDEAGIEWGTPEPVGSEHALNFESLFRNTLQLQ